MVRLFLHPWTPLTETQRVFLIDFLVNIAGYMGEIEYDELSVVGPSGLPVAAEKPKRKRRKLLKDRPSTKLRMFDDSDTSSEDIPRLPVAAHELDGYKGLEANVLACTKCLTFGSDAALRRLELNAHHSADRPARFIAINVNELYQNTVMEAVMAIAVDTAAALSDHELETMTEDQMSGLIEELGKHPFSLNGSKMKRSLPDGSVVSPGATHYTPRGLPVAAPGANTLVPTSKGGPKHSRKTHKSQRPFNVFHSDLDLPESHQSYIARLRARVRRNFKQASVWDIHAKEKTDGEIKEEPFLPAASVFNVSQIKHSTRKILSRDVSFNDLAYGVYASTPDKQIKGSTRENIHIIHFLAQQATIVKKELCAALGLEAPHGLPVAAKGQWKKGKRDYNAAKIPEDWKLFDDVPVNPTHTPKGERATQEHLDAWKEFWGKSGCSCTSSSRG